MLPVYPWAVFGAGALLGWRFHRVQLVAALGVLFTAERALATAAPDGVVTAAVAVLLPLDLAALAWLSERALRGAPGKWALALVAAEPLAVALLGRPELEPLARALTTSLVGGLTPAVLAFVLALALASARLALVPAVIQSAFLWALVAAFLGVFARAPAAASVYLATGGLVLVIALVETSHRMAYVDELTGLPGRRALNDALLSLGERYAIAMVDIDHFKRFNDEHGHDAGDQLLRMIGASLGEAEGGGRAFRYGGEEFAVLYPGRAAAEALPQCEALRRRIEATAFTLRGRDRPARKPAQPRAGGPRARLPVTVSIGVAGPEAPDTEPDEVVRAADRALYRAKRGGRNRVYSAG